MKSLNVLLLSLFCSSGTVWAISSSAINEAQPCSNAKECLNDFIEKEASGATDIRFDYVRYSNPNRAEEYTVFWQGTSFKVVDGYTLIDTGAVPSKGMIVFKVRYHVVGHTTGVLYSRVLHKDTPHYEEVPYYSKKHGGWVVHH